MLLIGEPEAGKTNIASLLAMAALDQWNASTLKLDKPDEAKERWNPDEPSQFFWIDDAFGVSQYESHLVYGWNHRFPDIRAMLKKGAKIVMTSRDYNYNRVRRDLKEGAFPLLRESQVVFDVRDLTLEERRQILYNHLKLGRQPEQFRAQINLKDEFIGDKDVESIIEKQTKRLNEWIVDHSEDNSADKPGGTLGDFETPDLIEDTCSIFDDVDA